MNTLKTTAPILTTELVRLKNGIPTNKEQYYYHELEVIDIVRSCDVDKETYNIFSNPNNIGKTFSCVWNYTNTVNDVKLELNAIYPVTSHIFYTAEFTGDVNSTDNSTWTYKLHPYQFAEDIYQPPYFFDVKYTFCNHTPKHPKRYNDHNKENPILLNSQKGICPIQRATMPFPTYNPMREYWNHSELVNLWFTHSYQLDNNVFEALSNPNNIGKWFTMTQYETRLCGLRGYFTVNAMLLSISTEHPFEADKILGGEDRSNWVYTLKPIEITRPDDCPMERPFMVFYMKYEFSNFS